MLFKKIKKYFKKRLLNDHLQRVYKWEVVFNVYKTVFIFLSIKIFKIIKKKGENNERNNNNNS